MRRPAREQKARRTGYRPLSRLRSLILGNSGGIVGLAGALAGLRGRASSGLGFAALEVFPQRRSQSPLPLRLLQRLWRLVHSRDLRSAGGEQRNPGDRPCACATLCIVARIAPVATAFHHSHLCACGRRCRSSVVEHPLGKGEVVSSILTGSTRNGPSRICRVQPPQAQRKNSGEISLGRNNATSGHTIISTSTPSIGSSMIMASLSASTMRMPATAHEIIRQRP